MKQDKLIDLLENSLKDSHRLLLESRNLPVKDPVLRKQLSLLRQAIGRQWLVLGALVNALEVTIEPKRLKKGKKSSSPTSP
jgi:hypothetical protein